MEDDALESYLADLGISDEAKLQRTPKTSPTSDTQLEPPQNRPELMVEEFLTGLLKHFGPGYFASASLHSETVLVDLSSRDLSRVIGKEGQTLMAIELLCNTYLSRTVEPRRYRVIVDAAGYRDRYEGRLVSQATKAAAEVRKTGREVELSPMSPPDRRVIHMLLADEPDVITESTGEGRDRRIVVKPRPQEEISDENITEETIDNQENA